MKFHSHNGGEDGEYNGIDFLEISKTSAMQDGFSLEKAIDRVYCHERMYFPSAASRQDQDRPLLQDLLHEAESYMKGVKISVLFLDSILLM